MADCGRFYQQHWASLQQADLLIPRPNPTFANPPFEDAGYRVLIVRLSPYHDVDRSASHLFLFDAVRRAIPDAYVDIAFLPPRHDRERILREGVPMLVGSQSYHTVDDFDLVLISNAYLLELINLPYLLEHSGIPLMASERGPAWPPIILGGSNATATQAIVAPDGDSLVDAIFLGEGEESVTALVREMAQDQARGKLSRLDAAAAAVRGLWLAGRGPDRPAEKAVVRSPSADHLPTNYPLLNGPEAHTARLQISYGCPAFCSFCYEGYDRKPYREVSRSDVLAAARRLKRMQGCEALELFSFNFNTHRDIVHLLVDLSRLFDRVGMMSQRVDLLDSTPGLLEAELAAGKRHFGLGIEGISAGQRAWLHKSLDTGSIVRVIGKLLDARVRQVKLFYLLTGHEEAEDVAEFREFVGWLKAKQRRDRRGARVTFSFGWLVRMPFTPLRYDRLMVDRDDWRAIVGPVKSACETNGFEFRMATEWDEYCTAQILAIGGHWLYEPMVALAEQGHCFDGSLSSGYWEALRGMLVRRGHWTPALLDEKGPDYPFAMPFVRSNVPSSFLYRQYEQAKAGIDSGYCLGTAQGPGRCLACGACEDAAQREAITAHFVHSSPDLGYAERLAAITAEKARLKPVYVHLRLPSMVAGTSAEWMSAWLMRELLGCHPSILANLLSTREALFTVAENRRRYPVFHGETVFAFKAWDSQELLALLLGHRAEPPLGEAAGPRDPGGRAGDPGDDCAVLDRLLILGLADEFEPGRFVKAEVTLELPGEYFPDAGWRLVQFLRGAYVPCNVRRAGDTYSLELPDRALRKRAVFAGEYMEDSDGTVVRLSIGQRFDLGAYLGSFGGTGHYRRAQVAFSELVW